MAALNPNLCSTVVRFKGAGYVEEKMEARKPAKLLNPVTTPAHIVTTIKIIYV